MNQYINCSREELLRVIEELEAKNERLSDQLQGKWTKGKHRFKEKYAIKILDALPDMLSVLSHEGLFVDLVSSEDSNHVGATCEELIDKDISSIVPPEAYKNIKENLDKVVTTNKCSVANHDLEVEGVLHHFENRIFPLDEENVLCMCRDVTESVKAREELELMNYRMKLAEEMASQRLHELEMVRYAVNNAVEEIYACDMEGSMIFANNQFLAHHQLVGSLSAYKIFDVDFGKLSYEEWKHQIAELKSQSGPVKYNIVRQYADGGSTTLEIVAYIVKNHQGEELTWFFARDITLRVEQETKINELNYVMNAILNNIPVYLFVKDPGNEFRYLYWNKAFEEYSQITSSRAVGHTDAEIFPNSADAEKFRKDDLRLLQKGSKIEFQEEYTTLAGEQRVVNTLKTLVPSEKELPWIIGISWDITELKNTEKELIDARIKAEQSDKLKSAFLANMSHEIRTPLNAIVGFSKLLVEAEDESELKLYSEIIDNNAELLLQLINDILDLSKIEAGTLEFIDRSVNLRDLCLDIYEIHRNRTHEGVTLIFEDPLDNFMFYADPNRILQVITNLITNAIKFTSQGEIRFGFSRKGGLIEFYVKDSGVGIPKDKVDLIFNRFIKLNCFAQGTGLGLAICRMIIEKLGGQIWAESEDQVGSIFCFSIPYKLMEGADECECAEVALSSFTSIDSKTMKTVLIAEDIESNFLLLKAVMGKYYRLVHARNGLEAVDLAQEINPDLILMDIKMPEMNGLEATQAIRTFAPNVPIVALTAFAFESDKKEALAAGCNDFVTKPIAIPLLNAVLNKYLGHSE